MCLLCNYSLFTFYYIASLSNCRELFFGAFMTQRLRNLLCAYWFHNNVRSSVCVHLCSCMNLSLNSLTDNGWTIFELVVETPSLSLSLETINSKKNTEKTTTHITKNNNNNNNTKKRSELFSSYIIIYVIYISHP
jgi:hypothetical protein